MHNGIVVSVLPKTRLEYSYLTASTSQSAILQPAIDVSAFYYYNLIIRVHERSFSSSQTIQFSLTSTLPSEEDPREFSSSTSTSVTLTGAAPSAVPGILSLSGTDPGAFLKFSLIASQPAGGGILYAEVSAVLVLRSA